MGEPRTSIITDPMGNVFGDKGIVYEDIPSDTNKAYEMPLNSDGGTSPSQGVFADQVEVAHEQTQILGLPFSVKNTRGLVAVVVVIVGLVVLWKVLK